MTVKSTRCDEVCDANIRVRICCSLILRSSWRGCCSSSVFSRCRCGSSIWCVAKITCNIHDRHKPSSLESYSQTIYTYPRQRKLLGIVSSRFTWQKSTSKQRLLSFELTDKVEVNQHAKIIRQRSFSFWSYFPRTHTKEADRSTRHIQQLLECGPMPNAMAALSNIGGALCWTPQFGCAHY